MARQRRQNKRDEQRAEGQTSEPADLMLAAEEANTPLPTSSVSQEARRTIGRVVLVVIVLVFVLFQGAVLLLFRTDSSMKWKRELSGIDEMFARGEFAQAAKDLEAFGGRYPDAKTTRPWNEKMGRYAAAAGDWATAAKHYAVAVAIDDKAVEDRVQAAKTPGLRAFAGEAAWKAGDRDAAIPFLAAEIKDINRSVGDHDRANIYLGLALKEEDRLLESLQHFQSISDRETFKKEIAAFYSELDVDLLNPIREKAKSVPLSEIP